MKKISDKQKQKLKEKEAARAYMFSIFMDIWLEREHKSEVSGRWLGKEALSTFFHHILPKSKHPEAMFDPENIILLTFEEHQKVENDPTFYEEVNRRRDKLKLKYERLRRDS
jgi:hypothetical protein